MTTIYLIRHSEPMKRKTVQFNNSDSLQIWNEKAPLSINGEKKAEILSKTEEMKNIDLLISSNYVRSISTAKYIADENNLDLYIDESFSERKHGVNDWSELPEGFETRQMMDPEFKIGNGENQIEVANRMYNALLDVLQKNDSKRIAIVSHATAIAFLLIKLGKFTEDGIYVNDKIIIDKDFKWNAPEVFRLEFDNNILIDINAIDVLYG